MQLARKQRGVAFGMTVGLGISIVIVFGSQWFIHLEPSNRIGISFLFPSIALFVAIVRLAKHRFFTAEDIEGSALTAGSEQARLLQALLQNALEQLALAIPVYLAALFSAPSRV